MEIKNLFFNTEDFKLEDKKIGEGTFGKVYLATNVQDNKKYAVKILQPEKEFNGSAQMQFMQESVILQRLKHPGIVFFKGINFQSFSDSQKLEPSIITEYLSRGSLKDILIQERKGTAHHEWTPTKKYITIYGIGRAMKYLHENNIIHRDLKTANILIDDDFFPRICDFGLSRCFPDTLTESMKLTNGIGTPIYMAPELFDEETQYDKSIDVYAFSMIVYEIISGKVPYFELGNISPFSLSQKVTNGYRPKITDNINKSMRDFLNRCWSHKPEERPSFTEICDLLETDFSYFDEDVDQDEFNYYLETFDKEKPVNKQEKVAIFDKEKPVNKQEKVEIFDEERTVNKQEKDENKNNNDLFLALDLLLGDKKARNSISSVKYLKDLSHKGDAISSYLLGLLYESGEFVEQNIEQSEYYYNESGKQGNSSGYKRIGECFMNGYGTSINSSKAFEYIEKASKLGNSQSIVYLGDCYNKGIGVKPDKTKAIECYKKSSELGNLDAIYRLSIIDKNLLLNNYSKIILPLFFDRSENVRIKVETITYQLY